MAPTKAEKKAKKQARKVYCKKCSKEHERPVGKNCMLQNDMVQSSLEELSGQSIHSPSNSSHSIVQSPSAATTSASVDPMQAVLQKLQAMEDRQNELFQKVTRMENAAEPSIATSSPIKSNLQNFQASGIVPSLDFL